MAQVTIYTTPTCTFCKQTKAFYQENNIEYEEKNVAEDTAAAQEMVEKSHQMGVPVSVVHKDEGDPDIIVGFDKAALMKALNIN